MVDDKPFKDKSLLNDSLAPAYLKNIGNLDEHDLQLNMFLFGCATKKESFDVDLKFFYTLCENGGVINKFHRLKERLNCHSTTIKRVIKRLEAAGLIEVDKDGGRITIRISRKFCQNFERYLKALAESEEDIEKTSSETYRLFRDW